MKKLSYIFVIVLFVLIGHTVKAQKGFEFPDSVKYKKNVIRWNITPFILWGSNNINFSYERVLKPYRSVSVNAGYWVIPTFAKGRLLDSLNITHYNKKSGFNLAADYRFYFKKLNVAMAPAGLYWGVYGSYYHYQFENAADLHTDGVQSQVTFGGRLNVMSVGLELGYQFIIKERLSIDLIFLAPSIAAYNTKLTLNSNLNIDQENEYLKAIYDALAAKIPGFDQLANGGYSANSGVQTNIGVCARYLVQIGYRF
jgi:hypothetical protein